MTACEGLLSVRVLDLKNVKRPKLYHQNKIKSHHSYLILCIPSIRLILVNLCCILKAGLISFLISSDCLRVQYDTFGQTLTSPNHEHFHDCNAHDHQYTYDEHFAVNQCHIVCNLTSQTQSVCHCTFHVIFFMTRYKSYMSFNKFQFC